MLQTLTHNYYSIIDPPNVEELLDAVENANLMDEQEFTWTDGCLIEVERLNLNDNFFNLIRPSLSIFFDELNIDPTNLGVHCHEVWRNTYKKNFFQEIHDHTPMTLSGVLFLTDQDQDDGGMFFFYNEGFKEVPSELRELNFSGCREYIFSKRGRLLLFPSYMLHGVTRYKSDIPRKTVSFNIILRPNIQDTEE